MGVRTLPTFLEKDLLEHTSQCGSFLVRDGSNGCKRCDLWSLVFQSMEDGYDSGSERQLPMKRPRGHRRPGLLESMIGKTAADSVSAVAAWISGSEEDDGFSDCARPWGWNNSVFEIFTDSGAGIRIADLPVKKWVSETSDSGVVLAFVRREIEECAANHHLCGDAQKKRLPTRIIDISDPDCLRLVEANGERALYGALSHCWGKLPTLKTTTRNYESHLQRIPEEDLSKTFKDAIDFCRKLNIKYLWIDSLCILQDERSDWHRESTNMRDIYRDAFITIAATASADGSGGCYQEHERRRKHIANVLTPSSERVKVYSGRTWQHLHETSEGSHTTDRVYPLLRRAWAFQERLLSSRVVHFTPYEVMWECRQIETCECRQGIQNDDLEKSIVNPVQEAPFKQIFSKSNTFGQTENQFRFWKIVVERYSRLALTYHSDALPALSGIAKYMDNVGFGDYRAGLWQERLLSCLCWHTVQPARPRITESSAPSWSWASVTSPVLYSYAPKMGDRWLQHEKEDDWWGTGPSFKSISCALFGIDVHGEVNGGRLKIQANLAEAWPTHIDFESYERSQRSQPTFLDYYPVGIALHGKIFACAWDDDLCLRWTLNLDKKPDVTLYCMLMDNTVIDGTTIHLRNLYMVLTCVDGDMKTFRRVGFITPRDGPLGNHLSSRSWSARTQAQVEVQGQKVDYPFFRKTIAII